MSGREAATVDSPFDLDIAILVLAQRHAVAGARHIQRLSKTRHDIGADACRTNQDRVRVGGLYHFAQTKNKLLCSGDRIGGCLQHQRFIGAPR